MNDEPYASQDIPDIVMEEGTTDSSVVLNSQPYFSDIEFDTLHYSAVVDPLGTVEGSRHNLSAEVDELSRALEVRAPGDFFTAEGSPVPVWVYCDDDTRVNTIEDGYLDEGGLVPNWTHQEVLVTVINVNDDTAGISDPL